MRPVLFEISLPQLALPLGLSLGLLALFAALLAAFGYLRRAPDLMVFGVGGALASLVGAIAYRGRTYTPAAIPVMSYGVLLATSLALGWVLTLRLAERSGQRRDVAAHAYVLAAICGIAGARLLYAATNPTEFRHWSEVFSFSSGGLAAYGGFLGGFLGAWWALRRLRANFLVWADAAAPSVALGLGLTRLGCYLHGCDFGRQLPGGGALLEAAGTFPRWSEGVLAGSGSPAWVDHVLRKGLSPASPASLPVHPTQLYESLVGLGLFALAIAYYPRRRFAGELFLALALGYGGCRFLLELFRDDAERGQFGPALPGLVWVGIGLALVVAAVLVGPLARRLAASRQRLALGVLAGLALLAGGTALARHTAFARETAIALSTSQWLGLATVLAAAAVLRRANARAAEPHEPLASSN